MMNQSTNRAALAAFIFLPFALGQEHMMTRAGQPVEKPAKGAAIRVLGQTSGGLVEILPGLPSGVVLAGDRGCVAGEACSPQRRVVAARQTGVAGLPILLRVEGNHRLSALTVLANGEPLHVAEDASLPYEIEFPAGVLEGSLHVSVQMGEDTAAATFEVELPGARTVASTTTPNIRFITEVAEEGYWEVITGSNTGGRLVYSLRGCLDLGFSSANCPRGRLILGYTDRAERGEIVTTRVEASGVASRLGVIINGRIRGQWYNVPLPVLVPQPVSLNPNDDYITAFVTLNSRTTERRLPVGTRPF